MPDRMPNRMSEDMSDRMPEDVPVRTCINVMVGITRSKVIFMGFLGSELIEPSNISIGHTGRSVAAGVFNVSFFSILPFEDDPK